MKLFEMIILTCILAIHLIGCTSTSSNNKFSTLNFTTVLNFKVGTSTQTDILSTFGEPSDIIHTDQYYVLNYIDPQTGLQRLSLNISKKDKKLMSLFWIPKVGESESTLTLAKKSFKNSLFQAEDGEKSSSHLNSSDILFYIDKSAGVTIRYDKKRNTVEAIALYDRENRTTSSE